MEKVAKWNVASSYENFSNQITTTQYTNLETHFGNGSIQDLELGEFNRYKLMRGGSNNYYAQFYDAKEGKILPVTTFNYAQEYNKGLFGNDKRAVFVEANEINVLDPDKTTYHTKALSNMETNKTYIAFFRNGNMFYTNMTGGGTAEKFKIENDVSDAELWENFPGIGANAYTHGITFAKTAYFLKEDGTIDKVGDDFSFVRNVSEVSSEMIKKMGGKFGFNGNVRDDDLSTDIINFYSKKPSIDYDEFVIVTRILKGFKWEFYIYDKASKQLRNFDLSAEINLLIKETKGMSLIEFLFSEEAIGVGGDRFKFFNSNVAIRSLYCNEKLFFSRNPQVVMDLNKREISKINVPVMYTGPVTNETYKEESIVSFDFENKKVFVPITACEITGGYCQGLTLMNGFFKATDSAYSYLYKEKSFSMGLPGTGDGLNLVSKWIKADTDSWIYFEINNDLKGINLEIKHKDNFYSTTETEVTTAERMDDAGEYQSIDLTNFSLGATDEGRRFRIKILAGTFVNKNFFVLSLLGKEYRIEISKTTDKSLQLKYNSGAGDVVSSDGTIPSEANSVTVSKKIDNPKKGQVFSLTTTGETFAGEPIKINELLIKEKWIENRNVYLSSASDEILLSPVSSVSKNDFVFAIEGGELKFRYEIGGKQKEKILKQNIFGATELKVFETEEENFMILFNDGMELKALETNKLAYGNELIPKADESIQNGWLSSDEAGATLSNFNNNAVDVIFPIANVPTSITITLTEKEYLTKLKIKASSLGKFIKECKVDYSVNGGTDFVSLKSETLPNISGAWEEIDLGGIQADAIKITLVSGYDGTNILIDELKLVRNSVAPAATLSIKEETTLNRINGDSYNIKNVLGASGMFLPGKIYFSFVFTLDGAGTLAGGETLESSTTQMVLFEKNIFSGEMKRKFKKVGNNSNYAINLTKKKKAVSFIRNQDDTLTYGVIREYPEYELEFGIIKTGVDDVKEIKKAYNYNELHIFSGNGGFFLHGTVSSSNNLEMLNAYTFDVVKGIKTTALPFKNSRIINGSYINYGSVRKFLLFSKDVSGVVYKYKYDVLFNQEEREIINDTYGDKERFEIADEIHKNGHSLLIFDNLSPWYDSQELTPAIIWQNIGKDNLEIEIKVAGVNVGDYFGLENMTPGQPDVQLTTFTLTNSSTEKTIRGMKVTASGDQNLISGVEFSIDNGSTWFNKEILVGDINVGETISLVQRITASAASPQGDNKISLKFQANQY